MSEERTGTGLTILGKLLTIALIAGLIAGGYYLIKSHGVKTPGGGGNATADAKAGDQTHGRADAKTAGDSKPAVPAEMKTAVPRLDPPAPYTPKDNTVDIELSEYAGYAGLIAANGGLDATENSVFFKKHGFNPVFHESEGGHTWPNWRDYLVIFAPQLF